MYTISDIIAKAKEHGLIGLFTRRIFYREEGSIFQSCLLEQIPEIEYSPDILIRRATLADVDELYQLVREHNYSRTKEDYSEWITRGDFLLVAIAENRIVGYFCESREVAPRYRTVKGINFKNDDVWGRDAFVRPEYRRQNIFFALGVEIMKCSRAAGYRRELSTVSPNDISARLAHRKRGCKDVGRVICYKFLFFRWAIIRPIKDELTLKQIMNL
jgi:GNAT superfamily N-acetyltransferase